MRAERTTFIIDENGKIAHIFRKLTVEENIMAVLQVMDLTPQQRKEKLENYEGGNILVKFEKPKRAITPGQSVVFYDGDVVVGGGIIESVLDV